MNNLFFNCTARFIVLLLLIVGSTTHARECEYRNTVGGYQRSIVLTEPDASDTFTGNALFKSTHADGIKTSQGRIWRRTAQVFGFEWRTQSTSFKDAQVGELDKGLISFYEDGRIAHLVYFSDDMERIYQRIRCQ